jgi:hypothetical protein
MLKLIIASVGSLLVTAFCFGQAVHDARRTGVLESVYRYQIAQCYKDRSPETYFVSYVRSNPDEAAFARLAASDHRVKKVSLRQFNDAEIGRSSITVSISDVDFRSQRIAYVRGSCIASGLDAYSYLYRVEFRWGRWIVMRRKLTGFA